MNTGQPDDGVIDLVTSSDDDEALPPQARRQQQQVQQQAAAAAAPLQNHLPCRGKGAHRAPADAAAAAAVAVKVEAAESPKPQAAGGTAANAAGSSDTTTERSQQHDEPGGSQSGQGSDQAGQAQVPMAAGSGRKRKMRVPERVPAEHAVQFAADAPETEPPAAEAAAAAGAHGQPPAGAPGGGAAAAAAAAATTAGGGSAGGGSGGAAKRLKVQQLMDRIVRGSAANTNGGVATAAAAAAAAQPAAAAAGKPASGAAAAAGAPVARAAWPLAFSESISAELPQWGLSSRSCRARIQRYAAGFLHTLLQAPSLAGMPTQQLEEEAARAVGEERVPISKLSSMARKVLKGARLLDGRQPKGGGSKRWWVPAKAEKRAKAVVAAARAAGALPGAAQPAAARAPDPAAAHAGQVQQPVDAAAGPAAQGPAAAAAAVAAPAAAAAHPVETLIQEKGPQFLATTRALVYKLTADNVGQSQSSSQLSRVRITHRVYWQLIDNIPHIAERLQPDEDDEPLHIRLTHPASGQAWEVPLVCVQKDGYQFEEKKFADVLKAIGAYQPGSWLLLELDAEQCSKERLVGTIRCVDGAYSTASLHGCALKRSGPGPAGGLEFKHAVCSARYRGTMPKWHPDDEDEDASQHISGAPVEEFDLPRQRSKRRKSAQRQAWDGVRRVLEEMLEFGCVQGVFDAPVDLQEYPDYADHVERPMDLGTIQVLLEQYATPLQVRDDVRLVWSNCRLYNPPGTDVRQLGDSASQRFEELWKETGVEELWAQHLAEQQAAAAAATGPAPSLAGGGELHELPLPVAAAGLLGTPGEEPAGQMAVAAAAAMVTAGWSVAAAGAELAADPVGDAASDEKPAGKPLAAAAAAAEVEAAMLASRSSQLGEEGGQQQQQQLLAGVPPGLATTLLAAAEAALKAKPELRAAYTQRTQQPAVPPAPGQPAGPEAGSAELPVSAAAAAAGDAWEPLFPPGPPPALPRSQMAPKVAGSAQPSNLVQGPAQQPSQQQAVDWLVAGWPAGQQVPGQLAGMMAGAAQPAMPGMPAGASSLFAPGGLPPSLAGRSAAAAGVEQPPAVPCQPVAAAAAGGHPSASDAKPVAPAVTGTAAVASPAPEQPAGGKPSPSVPTPPRAAALPPAAHLASPLQPAAAVPFRQQHAAPGMAAGALLAIGQQPPAAVTQPAAAAAAAGAPSGGSAAAGHASGAGTLADRAAVVKQQLLEKVWKAFEEHAADDPDSWVHPLRLLCQARKGGATLKGIISQWAQLPRETQQAVYNEALVATEEGSLGDLEEGLQMVLATAPLPEAPPAGPE